MRADEKIRHLISAISTRCNNDFALLGYSLRNGPRPSRGSAGLDRISNSLSARQHWCALMRKFAAAVLLFVAAAASALAAVPQVLNYQGKLGDSSGNPLTGTYSFRFTVWSAVTGGTSLFSEPWTGGNAVSVVNGIYTI